MEPLPTINQLGQPSTESEPQENPSQSPTGNLSGHNEGKPRRTRQKWTEEETQDLIKGCGIHGVGRWKK